MIRRQGGSFLALLLLSMLGICSVAAPISIAKSLVYSVDKSCDEQDTGDLIIDSSLGFTDSDIKALQAAEYIEAVSTDPVSKSTVSQESALSAGVMASTLYIYITGAKERLSMTNEYTALIDNAANRISTEIEPACSAARLQSLNKGVQDEINRLNESLVEAEKEERLLEAGTVSFNEAYEKAMEDYEQEQESINAAKKAIQANERNAQTSVEGAKKNLTKILNEVYSKSTVTASDIQRAQGASSYASGSEKSYHRQFTSQWAELSEIETQLHEEEIALEEEKERREQEAANEKSELIEKESEIRSRLDTLATELVTEDIHWTISNRLTLPGYHAAADTYIFMKDNLLPLGIILYIVFLLICVLISVSIVRKNRSRIAEWRGNGLSNRIISELFTRRSGLSVALGAVSGLLLGSVLIPVIFIYSDTSQYDITSVRISPSLLLPFILLIVITVSVSAASMVSYHFTASNGPVSLPKDNGTEKIPGSDLTKKDILDAIRDVNKKEVIMDEDELRVDELP